MKKSGKRRLVVRGLGLGVLGLVGVIGWNSLRPEKFVILPEPSTPAIVAATPKNWQIELVQRRLEKASYLSDKQIAYDWFTLFPFSQTDGIPMVLLKILPQVAPEIWGTQASFGENFGLFANPDRSNWPLPMGLGLSGLGREGAATVDFTSFTCGACHVGRVNISGEEVQYIRGGVNSEFNITAFFVNLEKTLNQLGADGADAENRKARIIEAFLDALGKAEASDANFFYGNATYGSRELNSEYEAEQIRLFRADAKALTERLIDYSDGFIAAYGHYLDKTYAGYQEEMLSGLAGMADATGVSSAHGAEAMSKSWIGRLLSRELLPDHAGLTDYMAVWDQKNRTAHWDVTGTELIDGGGQYNGNIPIPIYRNLAASMTMGLENTDLRVAAFSAELLDQLPPDPYPFEVDTALAAKGQRLFTQNCADCHQPNNGHLYRNIGTDASRSNVINTLLFDGAQAEFSAVCNPATEIEMYGAKVKPCETFDGRSLADHKELVMRPLGEQQGGYNATRLAGIWATAPYLHTGSVPTIYQLLVPHERPNQFTKSSLNYDTKYLGFSWDKSAPGGYLFDTQAFGPINPVGHDTDISQNDKTYKLDWSDDTEGAMALIEYLKTL